MKLFDAFGLKCGSKGSFLNFFNTIENWDYVGELLAEEFYGLDTISVSE